MTGLRDWLRHPLGGGAASAGRICKLLAAAADAGTRRHLALAALLVVAASGLTAAAPWLLKRIVDGLVAGESSSRPLAPALLIFGYVASQFLARCCTELRWLSYGAAEQRLQRLEPINDHICLLESRPDKIRPISNKM
jgi:ABC-type multidrug transport system fused ATPase/permease subunit